MRVKDLIEELQKLPPDAEMLSYVDARGYEPAVSVFVGTAWKHENGFYRIDPYRRAGPDRILVAVVD